MVVLGPRLRVCLRLLTLASFVQMVVSEVVSSDLLLAFRTGGVGLFRVRRFVSLQHILPRESHLTDSALELRLARPRGSVNGMHVPRER